MQTRKTVPSEMVRFFYEMKDDATDWVVDEDDDGVRGSWTYVTSYQLSKLRWHLWHRMVLQDPRGIYWGIGYGIAATEYQDHDLPWTRSETVELKRLRAEVKTIVTFTESADPEVTDD